MPDLSDIYVVFGSAAFVSALFFYLFQCADGFLHEDVKTRLSEYILAPPDQPAPFDLAEMFVELFEGTFDRTPWTRRFIGRSVIASTIAVVTMTIIYYFENQVSLDYVRQHSWKILLLGAGLNLIPDYISLVQSRYIIYYMRGKNVVVMLVLLLVDVLLTSLIVCVAFVLLIRFFRESLLVSFERLPCVLIPGVLLEKPEGVVIYTTYFTSVWVWLYMIAVPLARTRGMLYPLRRVVEIEKAPFRAVGVVAFLPPFLLSLALWCFGVE